MLLRKPFLWAVIVLSSLVLFGCGGGGGGGTGSGGGGGDSVPDTTPNSFSFTPIAEADQLTEYGSNSITISGIDSPANINVSGGEYSIDGGAFTTNSGTINNNQEVIVRHVSSNELSTTTTTRLTIGGVSASFEVTTQAQDLVADIFAFAGTNSASLNEAVESETITISGINNTASVSITGGEYSIDGGAYVSTAGTINSGQTLSVRLTAANTFSTQTVATVVAANVTANFIVVTEDEDLEPDNFSFNILSNFPLNSTAESNSVIVSGVNSVSPISIVNGEYSVNGGSYQQTASTVNSGDSVSIRLISSDQYSTNTQAELTIGGLTRSFSVTTAELVALPNNPPIVSAGPDQSIDEFETVSLSGTATDSDGSVASVQWVQLSGTTVVLNNADQTIASFQAPETLSVPQALSFQITATDNEGVTDSDVVVVTVDPVNASPLVSAGTDQGVDEFETVSLSGSASDSDGSVASMQWVQLSGATVTLTNADQTTASFQAPETLSVSQELSFEITAIDNEGATDSDVVVVTVNPVNATPVVSAGTDQNVDEQQGVFLSAVASDSDGFINSIEWVQISGPPVALSDRNILDTQFTSPDVSQPTELAFEIFATDNEGETQSDIVSIFVSASFNVHGIFPPVDTAYSGDDIDVTGRIDNFSGNIEDVIVTVETGTDSFIANIDDQGFWRAQDIPVSPDANGYAFIQVTAEDSASNTHDYSIQINTQPSLNDADYLVLDSNHNSLYTYSQLQNAVIKIDLTSGIRTTLSSNEDGFFPFFNATMWGMAFYDDEVDSDNNALYLLGSSSVFKVDLISGSRETIDCPVDPNVRNFDINGDGTVLYFATENTIYSCRISDQYTEILASDIVGEGEVFSYIETINYNPATHSLYAIDADIEALVSLDLNTLERSVVSSDEVGSGLTGTFLRFGHSSTENFENGQIYFTAVNMGSSFSVNLATGDREELFQGPTNGMLPSRTPDHFYYDLYNNLFYSLYNNVEAVYAMNDTLNSVNPITTGNIGGDFPLACSRFIKHIESTNSLLVSCPYHSQNLSDSLVLISLQTSERVSVGAGLFSPLYEFDLLNEREIVFSNYEGISKYNLYTETHTYISNLLIGNGPQLPGADQMWLNLDKDLVYVVGQESGEDNNKIIEVNISSGDRNLVFENFVDPNLNMFEFESGFYSADSELMYFINSTNDNSVDEIYTVSTETWTKSFLSELPGKPYLYSPYADEGSNELYFLIRGTGYYYQSYISKIDIGTQTETRLSDYINGNGDVFLFPNAMELDLKNSRAFVTQSSKVFSVDLESGDRAVLAQ